MNWFLIALITPALWAASNHIDKYLLSKYFKSGGVGALMVFSSVVGVFLLPFIVFLHPEVLQFSSTSLLIALNGFLYIFAVLPYFYALQKDEATITVPIFQLIPVFSYVLAYFVLGETLTDFQLIGGAFIVTGAVGMSLDLSQDKKIGFKKDIFLLMFLSSLLFALNFLFFKFFALKSDFWFTSFWEYVGFAIFATLLMLFVKSYRNQFFLVLKTNRINVLAVNGINEIVNIIAKISFNFASLLTPVTMVWIVDGTQPLFVFLYGVLLTLMFPHICKEDISKKSIYHKLGFIFVMFLGTYLINK